MSLNSPLMRLEPLHSKFGVEVKDIDLRSVDPSREYPAIRSAFEQYSLLLFRGQRLDDEGHLRLGALFGPIEDRSAGMNGAAASSGASGTRGAPRMDNVTNRLESGEIAAPDADHTLNLKANQLWHTDSTFLPVPALANILAARVLSSSGGETELASTRVAWREMPEPLRARVRSATFRHSFSHSRSKVAPHLGEQQTFTRWGEQAWRALWRNPVTGEEALYIASHVCAVEGLSYEDGQALIEELMAFITRPGYVFTHVWQPGDVLIWDERATVHRGRPWPYEEERTLASICVSARDIDGLASLRPG